MNQHRPQADSSPLATLLLGHRSRDMLPRRALPAARLGPISVLIHLLQATSSLPTPCRRPRARPPPPRPPGAAPVALTAELNLDAAPLHRAGGSVPGENSHSDIRQAGDLAAARAHEVGMGRLEVFAHP